MKIPPTSVRLAYYLEKYQAMQINGPISVPATVLANKIAINSGLYGQISTVFNIPWWVVGILHSMESSCDFDTHLANGDPLSADTVDVPAHIMAQFAPTLSPPFKFVDAAIAALKEYKDPSGWGSLVITDVPSALKFFDQWNGLGEWEMTATPGLPYLFSGSDQYTCGKFQSDGVWNASEVSSQIGAAVIMKAMKLT
jgi:lysozyme family protein